MELILDFNVFCVCYFSFAAYTISKRKEKLAEISRHEQYELIPEI